MIKLNSIYALLSLMILMGCQASPKDEFDQKIITEDIDNFWKAYDQIQTTQDSAKQIEYLQKLFVEPATTGQQGMIQARNYTLEEYRKSITSAPKFWNSLRGNTTNIDAYNQELREGIKKLKAIYPDLQPSTIYYTMGAHRAPGTGYDSLVLLGTEYALGDSINIVTSELDEYRQAYYKINPVDHLQFLVVHEYVHTQQKEMVYNLLSLSLYEGVAEFVACITTGEESPWKAMKYGPKNKDRVVARFEEDMFRPRLVYNWLYNSPDNEFQTADLGYYIGYAMASIYYENAEDKLKAVKTLIELDYNNEEEVERIVDSTNFLSDSLQVLYKTFEGSRPEVLRVKQFTNESTNVDPGLTQITLVFSEPMDVQTRGFDFGPLGEENVLRVQDVVGFSEDRLEFTFTVKLLPGRQYQSYATNRFLSAKGFPLKPFLIDFTTSE
ncbi:MAG: Ig-like domain-containing protein [Bacteroidota bacterium]